MQARAYVIAPIFCGATLWGLLAVYQNNAPRHWHSTEIQLVVKIANPLGVAVQQAELFAQMQRQAEDLKYAKEIADAANRSKSEFLANMSHELRTPLNAILGFAQLMMGDRNLTSEHQHFIEIVNQSGEHLLRLINDVLEMSKIEAGRVNFYQTEFDLRKLLRKLETMMQTKALLKGVVLRFSCEDTVPQQIKTDENKLRQILTNLLSNAIKFTDEGTVDLRVSVDPLPICSDEHPNTCHLTFAVKDMGVGMAPDELSNLFQPFTQTRSGQRTQEGTGLGLCISERFVRLMGGEITVQSQPGIGSCFTFFIPVQGIDVMPEDETKLAAESMFNRSSVNQAFRILIVEDNPTNRLLLNTVLSRVGFDVQEAVDGQEAIASWQAWQPHLIFMDMHMPTLDGYDATRHIRQLEQAAQAHQRSLNLEPSAPTKIIALTASVFSDQQQESLQAGCDDFLSKPFDHDELLKLLSSHLEIPELAGAIETQEVPPTPLASTSLSESLAIMPFEWRNQLYYAAAQGSDLESLHLISQIPADQPTLTSALTQLVQTYQFDRLLAHLQKVEPQSKTALLTSKLM